LNFSVPLGSDTDLYDGTIYLKGRYKTYSNTLKVELDVVDGAAETLGSDGGLVEVVNPDNPLFGVTIEVPPEALVENKIITIELGEKEAPAPDDFNVGKFINFSPDGIIFNKPVRISIPYDDNDNDGFVDGTSIEETALSVYTFSEKSKTWQKVPVVDQDTFLNILYIETLHFSQYTVSSYDGDDYVFPIYFNDNALVYDELPDLYTKIEDGYECGTECELGWTLFTGALIRGAETRWPKIVAVSNPVGLAHFFISSIPSQSDPLPGSVSTEIALLFDDGKLVKGNDTKNIFANVSSSIAAPFIQINPAGSYDTNLNLLMRGCADDTIRCCYDSKEILTKWEMNTYRPSFVLVTEKIDFCNLEDQLLEDQICPTPTHFGFKPAFFWPATEQTHDADVTIYKSGLDGLDGLGGLCIDDFIEICDDNIDNDWDGDTDCSDSDCNEDSLCVTSPEICDDNIDNDNDGDIDCTDPDCHQDPVCTSTMDCSTVDRFLDNNDGTVTDCRTGLVWLKNANCFHDIEWHIAMAAAAELNSGECGLSDGSVEGDWRLPRRDEMQGICSDPVVSWEYGYMPLMYNYYSRPGSPFLSVQYDTYWTSTEFDSYYAIHVSVFNSWTGRYGKPQATGNDAWPVRSDN